MQALQAEVVGHLPALDAHIEVRAKVPFPEPLLGDEVVHHHRVAELAIVQRQGHVQLVAPVAQRNLVPDLPVDPIHNLSDAGRKGQGLVLESVVGAGERQQVDVPVADVGQIRPNRSDGIDANCTNLASHLG